MEIETLAGDLVRALQEGRAGDDEATMLQVALSMETVALHRESIFISRQCMEIARQQAVALQQIAEALARPTIVKATIIA